MNIRISLPSLVNEGENLALAAVICAQDMTAPRLKCGFEDCDSVFNLRFAGDGWQGVTNVKSGFAGHGFLKLLLSDPSRPGREWRGELGVRFATRQQVAPIHLTGVSNQGEKSGTSQANSVNITVNSLGAASSTAQAESAWQNIEVFLHECDAPVTIPENPLPAPPVPSSPISPEVKSTCSQGCTDNLPGFQTHSQPHASVQESNVKRLNHGILYAGAAGVALMIWVISSNRHSTKTAEPANDPVIIINNNHGAGNLVPQPSSLNELNPSSDSRLKNTTNHTLSTSSALPPAQPPAGTNPQISPAAGDAGRAFELEGVKSSYKNGEYLTFRIKLAKPGFVRIQTLDESGAMTQLYPSEWDAGLILPAGQWISFPDPEVAAQRADFGYECYVPEGKSRDVTIVRVQWSPHPYTQDDLKSAGPFYQPTSNATWGGLATRGVRLKEGKPMVEQEELRYEVEK